MDELVALSKAKAGTLSYTAPSLPLALYLEKLKRERGADWVGIPFRGGGDTTNAVLSGSTPIAFLGMQNFISHLQAGTMNGLAVDGAQRSPLFPDIPTLAELGYRGNLTRVYFALVAPAGTPRAIVNKIREDVARIGNEPGFRKKQFIDRALEPILDTPKSSPVSWSRTASPPAASSPKPGCSRNDRGQAHEPFLPAVRMAGGARLVAGVLRGARAGLSGAARARDRHIERRRHQRHLHARAGR